MIEAILKIIEDILNRVQQNEIVMLLIGVGVLIFCIKNRAGLKRLPEYAILMNAFYILLATWFATVLEGFFPEDPEKITLNSFFNLLEHAGLAASSVLMAIWCWKAFKEQRKAE